MKIRTDFVSNSSSSNFLVAFPRNPKSLEDVIEMVFGDETFFKHPYGHDRYYPAGYPVDEVAKVIWEDVKKQIPNNKNFIFSRMGSVLADDLLSFYNEPCGSKDRWDSFDDERWENENRKVVEDFMVEHMGEYLYCLRYADDDGSLGCAMEHGDLFGNLPYLRSSNH